MSDSPKNRDPQRKAIMACGGLIVIAIGLVLFGRQGPRELVIDPAAVTRQVELHFTDLSDGTVIASDALTGAEIERLGPGVGGFIRVTMRSFASARKQRGMTAEEPFTLLRLKDGDLILTDRLTGRRMLLNAFGPSNERVFAELLDHGRMTQ
ncbi:putative photosynthetic complex assembly protein [Rhodoligotrophos appendicifer]|uniref:photosynthetic complex assembly protein PuhC n=1 Tax=Rhodoligotrophos appendicifer TaxID=987056 RepID=UPI00118513C6|nr:photosynthetic complex assembly protein PuhC [Rhodoligotrophos appendicifer]